MDAVGQLAKLVHRERQLHAGVVECARRVVGGDAEPLGRVPEVHGKPDEPLLGAVVQMALEAATLRVGGVDEPCPRRREPGREALALGDDGRQAQRGERRQPR